MKLWMSAFLFSTLSFAATVPAPLTGSIQGMQVLTAKPLEIQIGRAKKGTIITFLSARCPCSASHEAELKKLYRDFSAKGFQFVGIHSNTDESTELTQAHFAESKLPFPMIQDENNELANRLGALKTPHTFVISPGGVTLFQGGVDDSSNAAEAKKHFLKDALVAVAKGQEPPLKEARALGCVIKR